MRARTRFFLFGMLLAFLLLLANPVGTVPGQENKPQSPGDEDAGELANLHPFHRASYLSCRRAAEWLWQANRPDGTFVAGQIPALNVPIEQESFLQQAGGAYGLARAARFTNDERYAVRARQSVLTLLASTKTDPADPPVRFVIFPSTQANRLGAAAMLVLAIHELPAPEKDLLQQSQELCNYVRKLQRTDGSFKPGDDTTADDPADEDGSVYVAQALLALMRSQEHLPAAWKLEAVRRALPVLRSRWQQQKQLAPAPWLTSAFAEAYALTKDQAFAEFVFEINDWLCGLQYGPDPRRPLWQGGFASWKDGKVQPAEPGAEAAEYAAGLADACRTARQAVDLQRFPRYREATERCLQFLSTLQYTSANTRHFADWYRPRLYGGFCTSHQVGDILLESNQHAVCAMSQYLRHVAGVNLPGRPSAPR